MGTTMKENVIIPEAMAPMITAKIEALAKMTPYVKVDTTLQGTAGDTVTVPTWNYIGDAIEVGEGEEVPLTTMTAEKTSFTIKKSMKAVEITEEARLTEYGKVVPQAETQLAKSIVGKVDNDAMDAAYTSKVIYDGSSAVINYDGIVDAVTTFEDEEDGIDKVMFIHPKQQAALLKDDAFLSADKFTGGVAVNGAIGKIAGCWVKKSKKVKLIKYQKDNGAGTITIVEDGTGETGTQKHLATIQPNCLEPLAVGDKVKAVSTNFYANPIIKLEADSPETEETEDELPALTIFLKKDTAVTSDFKQRRQVTEIVAVKYYGVALTNGAKVIVAKFKA